MATKSPGIYLDENDNTQYINPKRNTGTTVCVVGFAKRGPIGVPVEISDYNSYVKIFGEVKEKDSSIAIKNILAAGGGVLFVRVADESATPSVYIIKNGSPFKEGRTYLNKSSDIISYKSGQIYSVNVSLGEDVTKDLFVRAPKSGNFKQSYILEQLKEQLQGNDYSKEYKFNNMPDDGICNYTVAGKTYYIEKDSSDKTFEIYNKIKQAAEGYNYTDIALDFNKINEKGLKGEYYFYYSKATGKNNTIKVILDLKKEDTLKKVSEQINNAFKNKKLTVRTVADEASKTIRFYDNYDDTKSQINIKTFGLPEELAALFVSEGPESIEGFRQKGDRETDLSFNVNKKAVSSTVTELIDPYFEYIETSDTIKFTSSTNINIIEDASKFGKFLFNTGTASCVSIEKGDNIESSIAIERDLDRKQIYFKSFTDSTDVVKIKSLSDETNTSSLLKLFEEGPADLTGYTEEEGKVEVPNATQDMIKIVSREKGSGTSNISVEFEKETSPISTENDKYNIYVYTNGKIVEMFKDISITKPDPDKPKEEDAKFFINLLSKDNTRDNGGSSYIYLEYKEGSETSDNPEVTFKEGYFNIGKPNFANDDAGRANELNEFTAYDYYLGTDGITDDNSVFLEALDKVNSPIADEQLYNFHILIHPDTQDVDVQDAAIALCAERKDAMTIIDPPLGFSVDKVIDWHNGSRGTLADTNYASMYWPWCKIFNSVTKKNTWVPPSVVMAAKYVSVDKNAGSWYAPAGETNGILSVLDIEKYANKTERAKLYLGYNRINPILKMLPDNFVVYGEKTLQRKDSALTKIHVRRMLIEIKKRIRNALRPYIFMPNTSEYLPKINSKVTAILEGFKVGGGLDSYRVICDDSNNTSETRQQDIINIYVAVVPNGVIEEIDVKIDVNKSAETITTN